MAQEEMNNALPWAGVARSDELKVAADDYHEGMPLAYNGTNDNYEYNITAPEVICLKTVAGVSANDFILCAISGADIREDALKTDTGAVLAPTQDIRQSLLANGVRLRKS